MIKLTRTRSASAIKDKYRGDKLVTNQTKLIKKWRTGAKEFYNKNFWTASKTQLARESHDKCAYCEANSRAVAHSDVEHYRPKSVYWWLAYCYDNYLLSCQICNQSYKGDKFPIHGTLYSIGALPATLPRGDALVTLVKEQVPEPLNDDFNLKLNTFSRTGAAEKAGIPHPYFDDPEKYLAWKADEGERVVRVVPKGRSARAIQVADACDKFLGLNRDELLRMRWSHYVYLTQLHGLLKIASAALQPEIEDAMICLTQPEQQFAGMARYFVHTTWGIARP